MPADDLAEYSSTAGQEPWEPDRIARWIDRDRVRAVALALIVVSVAWRAVIAVRGYFSQDEFVIAARAIDTGLTPGFLFEVFNGHLMPGGLLLAWLLVRVDGLAGWPWALMLVVGQAAVSVAFYLLLRTLLRPGWALLVPLSMFLFSTLTLEVSSLWMVGLLILPVQLSMVLAIAAQMRYARTGRHRYAIHVVLAVLLGLAFDTKALLTVPLLFVLAAALFCSGGLISSIGEAIRRFWVGWVSLTVLCLAYLPFYLTRPVPELEQNTEPGNIVNFIRDLIGVNLVPALVGGPWRWTHAGDGPPLIFTPTPGVWLAWAVLLVVVVVTVRRRAVARRAWLTLLSFVAIVTGLFVVTRLGTSLGSIAGLVPRYLSDVAVVAALCVGVALLGLRNADAQGRTTVVPQDEPGAVVSQHEPGAAASPPPVRGTVAYAMRVAAAVVVAILAAGNLWSIDRFNDVWATKDGREYLSTAQDELAGAPPGTAMVDNIVPDRVVAGYFHPDNLQSHFFRAARLKPVFVTEAVQASMFDDKGRIRPAIVDGLDIVPGPVADCGHRIASGRALRIPLEGTAQDWPWWIHIGYMSSGDSTITFRMGESTHTFEARRGLSQIFFQLQAQGDAVELRANDPNVTLCTQQITVGRIGPMPE
ncbi:ArnT family glycosyltransferase [Actinoplanes lutulentus]